MIKNKYKILRTLLLLIFITLCLGITYSVFTSNASLTSPDQKIAKFVFNTENLDELELSLIDLSPGFSKDYQFMIKNNGEDKTSEITIEYQMTIKTLHIIPLDIKLYKLDGSNEELIMSCDETYTRNEENELVCNTEIQRMPFTSLHNDEYKLNVTFSEEYNDETLANLVDFINIEIQSWQKIGV